MPLKLIDDGYTLTATAKAKGWPAVEIVYRPALPAKVRDYALAREKSKDGDGEMKAAASLLVNQIVSWDIVDKDDAPAAVTADTVKRLPDPVLQKILDLVTGYGREEAAADEKN